MALHPVFIKHIIASFLILDDAVTDFGTNFVGVDGIESVGKLAKGEVGLLQIECPAPQHTSFLCRSVSGRFAHPHASPENLRPAPHKTSWSLTPLWPRFSLSGEPPACLHRRDIWRSSILCSLGARSEKRKLTYLESGQI